MGRPTAMASYMSAILSLSVPSVIVTFEKSLLCSTFVTLGKASELAMASSAAFTLLRSLDEKDLYCSLVIVTVQLPFLFLTAFVPMVFSSSFLICFVDLPAYSLPWK